MNNSQLQLAYIDEADEEGSFPTPQRCCPTATNIPDLLAEQLRQTCWTLGGQLEGRPSQHVRMGTATSACRPGRQGGAAAAGGELTEHPGSCPECTKDSINIAPEAKRAGSAGVRMSKDSRTSGLRTSGCTVRSSATNTCVHEQRFGRSKS